MLMRIRLAPRGMMIAFESREMYKQGIPIPFLRTSTKMWKSELLFQMQTRLSLTSLWLGLLPASSSVFRMKMTLYGEAASGMG